MTDSATLPAVGVAVDNSDDIHAAVVVCDGSVAYAAVSGALHRANPREAQDVLSALTLIAVGQWAETAGLDAARAGVKGVVVPDEAGKCAALAGATAAVSGGDLVEVDLTGVADRAAAEAKIAGVVAELDSLIRSRTAPPATPSRVLGGIRLSRNGERVDPRTGAYQPGSGYEALLRGVVADQMALIESALRARAAQAS